VRQVIEIACEVTQCDIKAIKGDRRTHDPPILIGNAEKAKGVLGWQPQYPDLKEAISHPWQWHRKRHGSLLLK